MGLSFFGLTSDLAPETRAAIFKQIHQIVFHGNGGYDWHTVYNMPIWLRRFTFNEIQKYHKEEQEAIENKGKSNSTTVIGTDGKIKAPEHLNRTRKPIKYG